MSPAVLRRRDGSDVLYVGRLTRIKSVDVLIEAMRELPHERLTIVGDGPERVALEGRATDLTNVTFAGAVEHARVAEYLDRAKVLVLPSRQEGQPNVLMEAMGRGVPVIATAVGGVPDLVRHDETGWLTEPGDARAIAEGIRRISADADLRARMAANGVREMGKYDWQNVLSTLERTLAEVVSSRRKTDGRFKR
jgi:glycosyltransferase involved in cell wall biosynthesis